MKSFKFRFLIVLVFVLLILNVIDAALPVSTDGKCGANVGKRCADGLCCSQYNFCGNTPAYCQAGCQPLFGNCATLSTTTRLSTTTTTTTAKATPTPTTTTTTTTTTTPNTSLPVSTDGSCGANAGKRCGDGLCCSQYNFCGNTPEYCQTGCQPLFGNCGTPSTPVNGFQFDTCTVSNTIALTFDDGPRNVTAKLLDDFKNKNVKATFFFNGHGFPDHCIYDYADIVKRAYNEGHQVASHTWSHPHLTQVSDEEINYQFEQLEIAFKKIIGAIPTYFRPPFGEHNDRVQNIAKQRGYKMIIWDIDTLDWQENLQAAISTYDSEIKKSPQPNPHIVLNHDRIDTTSLTLGPYEASDALKRGYKVTTVGECIGQPNKNDWYRDIGQPQVRDSTWKCTLEDMHGA